MTQEQRQAAKQAAASGWIKESELLTIQRDRALVARDHALSDSDIDALLAIADDTPDKDLRNSDVFGIFADVRQWSKGQSDRVFARAQHRLQVLASSGKYMDEGLFLLRALWALNRPDADAIIQSFVAGPDPDMAALAKKLIAQQPGRSGAKDPH